MRPLSQDEVKQLLDYNSETGEFFWRKKVGPALKGARAGSIRVDGYTMIGLRGFRIQAHRLAFLWMTGKLPKGLVDHKNGIRSDNRWANLREVTPSQNHMNRSPRRGTSSRYIGVSKHKQTGKWVAQISVNGKSKGLGYFANEIDAARARDKAAKEIYGEFASLNFKENIDTCTPV